MAACSIPPHERARRGLTPREISCVSSRSAPSNTRNFTTSATGVCFTDCNFLDNSTLSMGFVVGEGFHALPHGRSNGRTRYIKQRTLCRARIYPRRDNPTAFRRRVTRDRSLAGTRRHQGTALRDPMGFQKPIQRAVDCRPSWGTPESIDPNDGFMMFHSVIQSDFGAAFACGRSELLVIIDDAKSTGVDHFVIALYIRCSPCIS